MKRLTPMLLALLSVSNAQADGLRDPMQPPRPVVATGRGAAAVDAGPTVTAVFSSPTSRNAIFNDRLVKAGDTAGAYVIEAVLDDGVRYRRGASVHEAHLPRVNASFKKAARPTPRAASGAE